MRKSPSRSTCCFYLGFLLTLAPELTWACGITLHVQIADEAVHFVKQGDFRDFLQRNQNTIRNGAFYPDSGFVNKKAGYGEFSHWEVFLNGFARDLDRECSWPLSRNCEKLFAFYLGSLAHSVGDSNFDGEFLTTLADREFGGNLSKAQDFADFGLDMVSIVETDRKFVIPQKDAPSQFLERVYKNLGLHVPKEEIQKNTDLLYAGYLGERALAPSVYLYYSLKSPWAKSNYLTAKGGVFDSALLVTALWEEAWSLLTTDQSFNRISFLECTGGWPRTQFNYRYRP